MGLRKDRKDVLLTKCPLGGMVDTADLKSAGSGRAGSSPAVGIKIFWEEF